jgi:L-asparaginase
VGIVLAGTGPGSLTGAYKQVVQEMRDKAPVLVIASRVGDGRVIGRTEYDELGMIPSDNLNPQKARILLLLALSKTRDPGELRRIFSEY